MLIDRKPRLSRARELIIVTNWLRKSGGAERITVLLTNILAQNYDVSLVVFEKNKNELANQVDPKIKIIYLQNHSSHLGILKLVKFLLKNPTSIYFAANHRIAVFLAFFRKVLCLKFKLVARNISNLTLLMRGKPKIFNLLLRLIYPLVDLVFAQSQGMAADLAENYNFNPKKIKILYNPVKPVEDLSCLNDNKNSVQKILFIGRLSKEKGLDYMLEALIKLKDRGHDFLFTILGDGPLKNELEASIRDTPLAKVTEFAGFQENVAKYLARSNLLLLSSIYEGFPNVLIQANSFGLPVVSFDTPFGPSEIIIEGVNGYLAKYLSVEDFVEKIELALATSWSREKILCTVKRFSIEKFKEGLFSSIESFE